MQLVFFCIAGHIFGTNKTRALRARTPRAPCICIHDRATWTYAVDNLYLHVRTRPVVSRAREQKVHHNVVGCGYDGQLKYTICDSRRPCHSILNTLKPVSRQIRHNNIIIRCAYNSLRCVHLQIWRFLCPRQQRRTRPITLPLRMRAE